MSAKGKGRKLEGKAAIITGSSRGMGRASALLFAENGANIVVNYHSNQDAAEAVVNKIKEMGGGAIAVQANVGNLEDHPKLVDGCLAEFGKIDILYHNAAMHYITTDLDDVTTEVWDMTYDQIIRGPFFLTKLVVPHMQKLEEGSILFTSTSSAGVIIPTDPHYMTAKSAMNTLVKLFAGWFAPKIRVNAVVPGFVKTDMFRHHSPERWQMLSAMLPMGRMATPMEVAQAALFLVSPEAAYLTGVALPVDGGRMASMPRAAMTRMAGESKPGLQRFEKTGYGDEVIEEMDVGLIDLDTDKKTG